MTEKPVGERIAVLEEQVRTMLASQAARATREWSVLIAVFGLLLTIFAKTMGFLG